MTETSRKFVESKNVLKAALEAYEERVRIFGGLLREAQGRLRDLRAEQRNLFEQLKGRMARACSLRRRDFDQMWSQANLSGEEDRLGPVLEELKKEAHGLCETLRRAGNEPGGVGLGEQKTSRRESLARLEEREREALQLLRWSQLRQEAIRQALMGLLSKGGGLRIKDLRTAIQRLRWQQKILGVEPGSWLREWEGFQQETGLRWGATLGTSPS